MKKLIEYTRVLRSKNAGPLYLTLDLIFHDHAEMEYVTEHLKKEAVAQAYGISPEEIDIIPFDVINAVKITFPRKHISGSREDNDVYGCQQHMPLANIEI